MPIQQLISDVFCVGSKDRHRLFFDELMPLSEGTSYNSYLIKGSQKTALIDTVYPPCHQELVDKLKELGIRRIDYIIANHGEQDHTGTLPELLALFPEAKIITNAKCKEITENFLPLPADRYQLVADGEELSLGDKTLRFIHAPWVHWPDTMFTFLKEDRVLFTCDFLGAHATSYDVFWDGDEKLAPLIKSYYAEIMMPFASIWAPYLQRIEDLQPTILAPSHGPAYRGDGIAFILGLYRQWSQGPRANRAVLLSVSMYGSTRRMAEYLKARLEAAGIAVSEHDATHLNATDLAVDLIDAGGIVVASPTVLAGLHPTVVTPLFLLNILKPRIKYAALIGSYSWGTLIDKQFSGLLGNMRALAPLAPVLAKGTPKDADKQALEALARQIRQIHAAD